MFLHPYSDTVIDEKNKDESWKQNMSSSSGKYFKPLQNNTHKLLSKVLHVALAILFINKSSFVTSEGIWQPVKKRKIWFKR